MPINLRKLSNCNCSGVHPQGTSFGAPQMCGSRSTMTPRKNSTAILQYAGRSDRAQVSEARDSGWGAPEQLQIIINKLLVVLGTDKVGAVTVKLQTNGIAGHGDGEIAQIKIGDTAQGR